MYDWISESPFYDGQNRIAFTRYAQHSRVHGLTAHQTIDFFERYGVFGFLEEPALQWQSLDNTVMDIDEYIEARA